MDAEVEVLRFESNPTETLVSKSVPGASEILFEKANLK